MGHNINLFWQMLLLPSIVNASPLFDTHVHYNAADAAELSPQQIVNKLDKNKVRRAVVTGTPASHTAKLYQHAPDRIVPFLSAYRNHKDKHKWQNDTTLPARIELELKKGTWYGIGELHIFAKDRHSRVFHRIIMIAAEYKLPLQIHGDPAVIDTVFDINSSQTVIWAHAGTFPYPDLIEDYLQRYPSLYIDLSVRDERVAPNGQISDAWYELLIRFPDRFMIGVDTFSLSRWNNYDAAVKVIRNWLSQLPEDIAKKISYDNPVVLLKP